MKPKSSDLRKKASVKSGGFKNKETKIKSAKHTTPLESKVKIEKVENEGNKLQKLKLRDKIVYPGHGVGVVENIVTRKMGDETVSLYVIKLENSDVKLFIPVDQVQSKSIRRIISPEEVEEIIESIKKSRKKIGDLESWNRRVREYSEVVKNCEAHELAALIAQFKSLNKVKNLSFGEKKILDTAKQLLASELSMANGTSVEEMTQRLDEIIGEY